MTFTQALENYGKAQFALGVASANLQSFLEVAQPAQPQATPVEEQPEPEDD